MKWLPISMLFLILPAPLAGQSLEAKVELQVQAALRVMEDKNPRPSTMLDPRIFQSGDSVALLAGKQLAESGIPTYSEMWVPDGTVALLNLFGVRGGAEGPEVATTLLFFPDRDDADGGFLDFWTNEYRAPFTCDGPRCTLGTVSMFLHADGRKMVECLDTYFAPEAEKPEICRRGKPEPDEPLGSQPDSAEPTIKFHGPDAGEFSDPPIFIVNRERLAEGRIEKVLGNLRPEDIEEINVLRGHRALSEYGPDGEHGVVELTVKDATEGPRREYHLRIAPILTRSLGDDLHPPEYGFGLGLDWLAGDHYGFWAAGYPFQDSEVCPVSTDGCVWGDFSGAAGASLYFLRGGLRPFVGIGRGIVHQEDGSWEGGLWSLRAGFDLTGGKWFGLRAELIGQLNSYWLVSLGVPLGVIGRSLP